MGLVQAGLTDPGGSEASAGTWEAAPGLSPEPTNLAQGMPGPQQWREKWGS